MASTKSNGGFRPNPKQRQLLEVLNNGRLMDTPALHELLRDVYPKRNTLQVGLHALQQHGYVVQVAIATQPLTPHGRPAATWAMGRRGSLYLGTPIKNNQTLTPGFREHELMVSRTYAALEKGCRMLDGFALASWERNQKLPPLKPSGYEKEEKYETDACSVVTRDTKPYRFYHEIDNKTEPAERHAEKWQSDFYRKVAHYQELYRRRAELLGEGAMRVLTSVPTPGRLRGLQTLCRRTDPRKRADTPEGKGLGIFWFTLHENIRMDDPMRFFFEPIWYLPAATKPQPLFDRPERKQVEEKAAPAADETIPPYSHDYDIPDGRPFGGETLG